jgi:urea carboxylase-associated protein 1
MTNHSVKLDEADAIVNTLILGGDPWMHRINKGQIIRIVDLEGNQAVDTLFYNPDDTSERYSALDTIRAQNNIYLTCGSVLMSSEGHPMLTITDDNCGRHDTLGGACAAESNTTRYALEKRDMHNCRDNFLVAIAHWQDGEVFSKRDLTSNINFFMNVPVTESGELTFEDGISGAGKFVEMRAEMDLICLISNCPQLNNPCNAYNPTPVQILIWDGC